MSRSNPASLPLANTDAREMLKSQQQYVGGKRSEKKLQRQPIRKAIHYRGNHHETMPLNALKTSKGSEV